MPGPVDLVYQLTPRDAAGGLWGFIHKRLTVSAAATSLDRSFANFQTVAPGLGTVLFLTRIFAVAVPGGAQNVTNLELQVVDPVNNVLSVLRESPSTETLKRFTLEADMPLLVGSQALRLIGTFDAGVAANRIGLHFSGYVLPRGNVVAF